MTARDFCYWLQGFFEIHDSSAQGAKLDPAQFHGLYASQVACIRNHLALVFKHEIDPSFGGPEKQRELNAVHSPHMDSSGGIIKC